MRCRVRFTPALSVYEHFEDDDDTDDASSNNGSPQVICEQRTTVDERSLFLLRRARRCWYSKEEVMEIRDKRKLAVKMLRRINANINSNANGNGNGNVNASPTPDASMYEIRGLESHLSPAIKQATYFKRKDALEGVLNEQNRQRQLIGGEEARDPERLRHVSQLAAEWFLHRALEFGKQDAKVAREFCACSKANVDDGVSVGDVPCFDNDKNQEGVAILHGSFALMDIDSGNDNDNSTLRFWADSSWTRNLMEE
mmetsp:Transcript_26385/g.56627  ORF Transcript_26385/g.56627 Transcript_26385/m.56627 type:complete len:255 (-) Transcript_26385:2497-3261(-)